MQNVKTLLAALSLIASGAASAGTISDIGADAYWGGKDHGYGDVIGRSLFQVHGAQASLSGGLLTVRIVTNFAGHAGVDTFSALKGIGYGDLFLGTEYSAFGADAHKVKDNSTTGTKWGYGLNLDNRWSNTGGMFTLYELNGATNAADILDSGALMQCAKGHRCTFRDGQETAVKTDSATVRNTGLTGQWKVNANKDLLFTIDVSGTKLAQAGELALHWGQTCQNDVVEGIVDVPEPAGAALFGLGLGLVALRRKRKVA